MTIVTYFIDPPNGPFQEKCFGTTLNKLNSEGWMSLLKDYLEEYFSGIMVRRGVR